MDQLHCCVQANAVSDKILDLRKCSYKGANLSGKTLAGALLSDADLSGTNLTEAVLTKAYAVGANLESADLTNAVVDRVVFDKANMRGAKFINAVVTGYGMHELPGLECRLAWLARVQSGCCGW